MIEEIPTDVYGDLFKKLTLQDIEKLCRTSRRFRTYCLENQKFIAKIKCKALTKFLQDNEHEVEEYAYLNKLCFDEQSKKRAKEKYKMCEVQNKFTVQLLYLVNTHMYDEAYVMLTCQQVVEPNGTSIFRSKMFDAFPRKLVELYMNKLPSILELFGYDNVNDFYEDWPLSSFRNKHLRAYIRQNVNQ
ncbi:hypothetical protein EB118_14750 [bacterium]|nr:hypothetical protein [bacterium]NDC95235.1 hypothetical protein [bacterium]NDD84986.1 hypothetical protein [bacterium]NDG31316.1 hypothetical protein [bacterium]